MMAEDRVAVGRVLGPWGVRGEVKIAHFAQDPDRFTPGTTVYAANTPLVVERSRPHKGYVVAKLGGIVDRETAAGMMGLELTVAADALPPPQEGAYYHYQLIGLAAIDTGAETLGTVSQVLETGANDVYVIDTADGSQLLLPAIREVVIDVDLERGHIVVDPPKGL